MSTILELCRGMPTQIFEPGAILFAEGKKSGMLCILVQGEVEILKGDFEVSVISGQDALTWRIVSAASFSVNFPFSQMRSNRLRLQMRSSRTARRPSRSSRRRVEPSPCAARAARRWSR